MQIDNQADKMSLAATDAPQNDLYFPAPAANHLVAMHNSNLQERGESAFQLIKKHLPEYAMEAFGLGLFMISACAFAALLEHPSSPVHQAIADATLRRVLMGMAMGLTAIANIYSPWGKQSGAHLNPATTLTFFRLGKVKGIDACFYTLSQFIGAGLGVLIATALMGKFLAHQSVNYVATLPGSYGVTVAFLAEIIITFILISMVLRVSSNEKIGRFTGFFAGILVATYISIEAPVSGMSMNPARSLASAALAQDWTALWIYFTAPPLGMLLAAEVYLRFDGKQNNGCAKLHHQNNKRCIHCGDKMTGSNAGNKNQTTIGETTMKLKSTKLFVGLFIFVAMFGTQLASHSLAGSNKAQKEIKFTVRIENISSKDFQTASNGEKWPFALSPGMWVIHKNEVRLFNERRPAILGLEAQAEDGNPTGIIDYLMGHHNQMQHGIFNTPVGTDKPAPIGPAGAYEFTFAATPGMRLSMITMFGQSNDYFYAPENDGIDLFDNGKPVSGDITAQFILWDAGTEVDQEPGIGADQAPRQSAANTGAAENGKVHKAKKSAFYTKTKELFRVTITPELMP